MYLWGVAVLEHNSHTEHNKGLDPRNNLWLNDLCMEVLSVYDNELHLFFGPRHTQNYQCGASDIAAVGTTFKLLSYDVAWFKSRNEPINSPNDERMLFVLSCSHGSFVFNKAAIGTIFCFNICGLAANNDTVASTRTTGQLVMYRRIH